MPPSGVTLLDDSYPAGYNDTDRVQVLVNRLHNMSCKINSGAKPPVHIEWSTDTARFSQGERTDQSVRAQSSQPGMVDQSTTRNRLTISTREVTVTPTLADHLAWFMCNVTHPGLDKELVTSVQLDVQGTLISHHVIY